MYRIKASAVGKYSVTNITAKSCFLAKQLQFADVCIMLRAYGCLGDTREIRSGYVYVSIDDQREGKVTWPED